MGCSSPSHYIEVFPLQCKGGGGGGGEGSQDTPTLWRRCESNAISCDCLILQARQFVEMEYSYKGEPVRKSPKLPTPICTPSGSPISSSVSLAAVCDDACYNRNSYTGKCMKRTRSLSEPAHQHENAFLADHLEMNDIKGKHKANSKPHNDRQPNNVTTSAIVTMPDFETIAVPNNIHEGTTNSRYENCNNRGGSHTLIWNYTPLEKMEFI